MNPILKMRNSGISLLSSSDASFYVQGTQTVTVLVQEPPIPQHYNPPFTTCPWEEVIQSNWEAGKRYQACLDLPFFLLFSEEPCAWAQFSRCFSRRLCPVGGQPGPSTAMMGLWVSMHVLRCNMRKSTGLQIQVRFSRVIFIWNVGVVLRPICFTTLFQISTDQHSGRKKECYFILPPWIANPKLKDVQ